MYGLVLEGGGAKGAYHMGAYRAILEEGIEIKGVAGTSIGALNGAMIVQGDYEKCCELWNDISYSMIINANDEEIERLRGLKLNKEDLRFLAEKIKTVVSDRGFDITPFKNLLNAYIDEDRIRSSNMDFGIVTINLTDFRPMELFIEDIPYGELKHFLMASAYLPAFKTEKIGGKRYLDGGFYDNLPFRMLQSKGYKDLIIVRTHARGLTRKMRLTSINPIIISPSDDIGGSYVFDSNIARRSIELGYYDGLRAFRGLKGYKYYLEPEKERDFYLNILLSLDDEDILEICQLIKAPHIPVRRVLFEYIVPKVGSALGLQRDFSYEDFIIGLLERKAEAIDVNRFKVYTFEELLNIVNCNPILPKTENHDESGILNKLIEKVDISTLFNKDEVILKVADIILSCIG